MMTRANTNSRLEAAATGRQDACPTALEFGAKTRPLAIRTKNCLTGLVYSALMAHIPTRVPGVTGQRPCEEKTCSGPANRNERWNAGIHVSWRRVTRLARVVPSLIQ